MDNNFKFSFILGYRHKEDRLPLLKRTLDWINGFGTMAEIILVEQDKNSKISHLNLNCKHVFVKSEEPYNRSWAFNVGLKYSTTDLIVFSDTDLIMVPNEFIDALNELNEFDMVSPYNSVVDLTPPENNQRLENIFKISRPGRGETDNQKINISGGITMYRKEAIIKIGGWSEDFIGWGGEDDFQTVKTEHFLKWKEIKGKCFHLYHQKAPIDQQLYSRTLKLVAQAKSMSKDDIQRHINSVSNKIGMLNKYDY